MSTVIILLLIICLLCVCAFEFINGFHDTANAVATVIYTNSLKPRYAVIWSGICNFLGVHFGGIGVAIGIINLLPVESLIDQNVWHSIAMVLALLITAIIWNLGTWYYGIPTSSSHTLIGSILGVGIAYSFITENTTVNWSKAGDVGMSLLLSPVLGFSLAAFLMFLMKKFIKDDVIFKPPHPNQKPPFWIRLTLLATCTGVSFSHGSNDGQKGVGLMMLVLIGILPMSFALNPSLDPKDFRGNIQIVETYINTIDTTRLNLKSQEKWMAIKKESDGLALIFSKQKIEKSELFQIRKKILLLSNYSNSFLVKNPSILPKEALLGYQSNIDTLKTLTDYAPDWVILVISLCLGVGTMVGWKRIVQTIGEKLGKEHLTYAQGASSELVAASTIGFSTFLGLPVSTTHILSSGVVGSMVASNGVKNLQGNMLRNIGLAWVLTLPFCVIVSGGLFLLLRAIL